MQPQRGKPPTKGAFQIMCDNVQISRNYRSMIIWITITKLIISGLYTIGGIKPNFITQSATNLIVCHFSIPILLLIISYFMQKISEPQYTNTPERRLISPSFDLSLMMHDTHGGLGQYLKELTVILVLAHLLTLLTYVFWFILILLPLRILYLFYKFFLRPILIIIFTDPESQDSEKTKKKAKKTGKKKFKYLRSIKHWHHFR